MSRSAHKRARRIVGAVVKVPLKQRWHTYARVLEEPLVAFYDAKSDHDLPPQEVIQKPILFTLWVMNSAITSGRWERVAYFPLEQHLQQSPRFFKQDLLDPAQLTIYLEGKEIAATAKECRTLERAAVWSAEHIEDRLRDHYQGMPNKWVASLRLKE